MNTTATGVRPRNRGFTLIELMVVLTVLAVMMVFAAPNFTEYKRNSALTNTANTLVSSVYRARSEAMKNGVTAILTPGNANGPSGTDWTQGWVIYIGFPKVTTASLGDLTLSITRTDKSGDRYVRRIKVSTAGRVRTCRPDVDTGRCDAASSSGGGGGGGGGGGSGT